MNHAIHSIPIRMLPILIICLTALSTMSACAAKKGVLMKDIKGHRFSEAESDLITKEGDDIPLEVITTDMGERADILHRRTEPVDVKDPELPLLISRMYASMISEGGVGIAANQVDIARRIVWVKRLDIEPDKPYRYYLNPHILSYSEDKEIEWEGCLSVPDGFGRVLRPLSIHLAYSGEDGKELREEVHGFTARIFQHEIDHLDGRLFTELMLEGQELMPKEAYYEMQMKEKEAEEAEREAAVMEDEAENIGDDAAKAIPDREEMSEP